MKILKLRFRNINSLAGDWALDFTQPAFAENGIFAITGKTGSGKTTILDAVSLALYGRTPRLGKITDSSGNVMTQHAKDCYSEIEFEAAGKIWKSSWKQKRTDSSKSVHRQIADGANKIHADKLNSCDAKIEQILRMNFNQFTKVVLLAQGGFAAFLQAKEAEKGTLLENITGTEIYGEISKKVFARNKLENQKLEKFLIELDAIKILANEDIERLKKEISEFGEEKILIDKELQFIEHAKKWLKDLSDLQIQIAAAKAKLPELAKKEADATATREKSEKELSDIKREQENFAPVFLKVRELDTKISEKSNVLKTIFESLKVIENENNKLSNDLKRQKNDWQKIDENLKQREELRSKNAIYASLVENYAAFEQRNAQVQSRMNAWSAKRTDFEKASKDLEEKNSACEKAVKEFNLKQQSHQVKMKELEEQKRKLAEVLNGKEITTLQSEKEDISNLGNTIKLLIDNLKNIISHQEDLENFEKSISENSLMEKELGVKKAMYKESLSHLKKQIDLLRENILFAKTIQSLNEHRKSLVDGEECPLCGAREHPFAMGNLPVADEKEKQLKSLQKRFDDETAAQQANEKQLAKAASDRENAEKNKAAAEKNLSENHEKNNELRTKIKKYEINFQDDLSCLEKLEEICDAKRAEWKQVNARVQLAVQMDAVVKRLRDSVVPQYQQAEKLAEAAKNESETSKKLAEKFKETSETLVLQEKEQYETDNAALVAKLKEFGVDNLLDLKKCRDSWMENEESIQKLNRQKTEIEGDVKKNESSIEANQRQQVVRTEEKEQAENLINNLAAERKSLFGDKKPDEEERLLKKKISDAENLKSVAEKTQGELRTELAKTTAVIQESEKRLSEKQAEKTTEKTSEALQSEQDAKKQKLDDLLQKIGARKRELEANHENLANYSDKLAKKDAQQQISERWKRLDALIGSADGKKYRNYAQALTFENLIALTNIQLKKMSERYILKRVDDGANPFGLSVIDKYQNCEERTAQNLSGGEIFIASLALALGLANMASRNMKIDTMFIDEGFGTLDSDYLNVAIDALSNLQSEGKLIGVISHLSELKERIATHIELVQKGSGRSELKVVF